MFNIKDHLWESDNIFIGLIGDYPWLKAATKLKHLEYKNTKRGDTSVGLVIITFVVTNAKMNAYHALSVSDYFSKF